MLLCEKFQARFGRARGASPGLILLNEAAIELSVPRRRLYDIINVLEAVEVRALPARCPGPPLRALRLHRDSSEALGSKGPLNGPSAAAVGILFMHKLAARNMHNPVYQ
jgi:hypothetical protein